MIETKKKAVEIALEARKSLTNLYGKRLRGVYLFGSAARDELRLNSDIDIAVVLTDLANKYEELKRTSKIGSDLTLEASKIVSFLFIDEKDFINGRFSIHRAIKNEGIQA